MYSYACWSMPKILNFTKSILIKVCFDTEFFSVLMHLGLLVTFFVVHYRYHESSSEWTLDYPPYFALFEWFLSQFASLFDPDMLTVSNLGHNSELTILFQRLTVIACDLVLFYAIFSYCSDLPHRRTSYTHVLVH